MEVTSLVVGLLLSFLLIGTAAGALASRLMRGGGLGLPGNIGVGIDGTSPGVSYSVWPPSKSRMV